MFKRVAEGFGRLPPVLRVALLLAAALGIFLVVMYPFVHYGEAQEIEAAHRPWEKYITMTIQPTEGSLEITLESTTTQRYFRLVVLQSREEGVVESYQSQRFILPAGRTVIDAPVAPQGEIKVQLYRDSGHLIPFLVMEEQLTLP